MDDIAGDCLLLVGALGGLFEFGVLGRRGVDGRDSRAPPRSAETYWLWGSLFCLNSGAATMTDFSARVPLPRIMYLRLVDT